MRGQTPDPVSPSDAARRCPLYLRNALVRSPLRTSSTAKGRRRATAPWTSVLMEAMPETT